MTQSLEPLVAAAGVEPVEVVSGDTAEETRERLDDAARAGGPALLVVRGATSHVHEWVVARTGWLLLDRPPEGVAVLASAALLATREALPGTWRRSAAPADARLRALEGELARTRVVERAQRLEIDRLRAELVAQREWVATEAERARGSTSWRVGHRLVRTARLLTFRRDHGTDALGRIAERMRAPVRR